MDIDGLLSVKGKVVLVTGGGRGIGYMISTAFVCAGAKVYISSRKGKACKEACVELNKAAEKAGRGGSAAYVAADLAEFDECKRLAKELGEKEKALDVLIHNSGANWGSPLDDYPDEAFEKVMNLNVKRVFTLTQALLPLLRAAAKEDDPARIIHIGSINGESTTALETFAYSSSKAALHHLSRNLALRLAPEHITCNTLACGPFQSKMMAETLKSFGDAIVGGIPLGRIGKPEDVGGACLFLSSQAANFITGATIPLDGGSMVSAKM